MRTARRETSSLRVQVLVIGENKEIWTERPEGRQIRLTAIRHVKIQSLAYPASAAGV